MEHGKVKSEGDKGVEKIAILGGGMAALTAAFELTKNANWQKYYAITVYQMGWRLGGKGASGRNPDRNDRIEEHGLHVWLGFYHHAFRLIRQCYAEHGRHPDQPLAQWQDAFMPCNQLAGIEYQGEKRIPWVVNFPAAPGSPGDDEATGRPGLWQVLRRVLRFMAAYDRRAGGLFAKMDERGKPAPMRTSLLRETLAGLKSKIQWGGVAVLEMLFVALALLGGKDRRPSGLSRRTVSWLLDRCLRDGWRKVEGQLESNTAARRSWIMLDFFVATLRGIHAEGVVNFEGMTRLDEYDFREFLAKYGASEWTLNSPVVCGFYNLGFAYLDGKKSQPSLAAGVMLRFSLQMFFSYRGAMFWKMRAGMGDAVFVPLYEVLRKRGVRFEFFQKVLDLELTEDAKAIGSIQFQQQARLRKSEGDYEPLVTVNGLPCWPDRPRFEQLIEGEAMAKAGVDFESDFETWPGAASPRLIRGRDFDTVILGIGLGALPKMTEALMAADSSFCDMVRMVPTVRTCAMQVWLKPTLEQLGWDPETSLFDGHLEAMSTWADMTHLVPVESWPEGAVGHLAYFCSVMEESPGSSGIEASDSPQTEALAFARSQGLALLDQLGHLFAGCVAREADTSLDFEHLVGGEKPIDNQFFKANINLSDRYVLAAKGTTKYRLEADGSGFENLILAGDWTQNGINYGCIEAATVSGIQAAQAILKNHRT